MMFVWRKLGVQKLSCRTEKLPPREYIDFKRTNTMRKITAIAVALGFLTSVSLPAYATPAVSGIVKSDELSAAKKKKKAKTNEMKKSQLGSTDLSAAKKKAKKKSENKTDLGTTDLSTAKKKAKKKSEKKTDLGTTDLSAAKKKAKKKSEKKTDLGTTDLSAAKKKAKKKG